MSNTLEFILKLNDLLTPAMRQAARISDTSAAKIQSEFDKISRGGRRMGASVDELRKRLDSINKVRFSTTIQREFDIATRAANKLERQIARLENKGSSGGGGMMKGFIGGSLIASGIQQAGQFVMSQVQDTYSKGLQMDSMRAALNATTGGQGNKTIAQTAQISDKLGLNYEASLEGVKTLTGGLKSMNMPLEQQMKIFEGVSSGMAAMKLNSEQAKGAMLALGQMASKGTVQAEELRGQLGERIPGAFGIAARSMGVTESKLNDMLQKGEVAAKDFLPRFAAEMQKTFGEDALRNANGPAAIQARFDNAIFKMKTTIGEGLMPLITPVIQTMTAFAQNILPPIQAGIQFLVDGLASITSGTSAWSGWFEVVQQISVRVFGFVKNILGTVYNIVSGIVSWVAKSQILQDVFWVIGKVVSGVMSVVEWIANKLLWVWDNVLRPVLEKIEWVYSKVKGLFDGGKKEIVVTAGTAEGLNAAKIPGGTLVLPPDTKGPKAVTPLSGTSNITPGTNQVPTTQTKEKAAAINGGGQRSITITIGKMIEKVEMRVVEGGKMAAEDLGSLVRGEILKVFNQIEATGA